MNVLPLLAFNIQLLLYEARGGTIFILIIHVSNKQKAQLRLFAPLVWIIFQFLRPTQHAHVDC